jgi:hypothetical protein
MRILGLTLFFIAAFYFFSPEDRHSAERASTDAVEVKAAAPARAVVREVTASEVEAIPEATVQLVEDPGAVDEAAVVEDDSHAEITHSNDGPDEVSNFEKRWQKHLKEKLEALEPEVGKDMFNAYMSERDNYQSELDALIENNQTNPDLENMIEELESKFDDKIKEIYGPHYEDIKEDQGSFSAPRDASASLGRGPAVIATR